MSLLLDALKKAEAKQTDAKAQSGADTAALRQETRLELEALEQPKTAPSARGSAGNSNARQSMQAMLAERAALNQHSSTIDWLTFPIVVAGVLIIGGLSGSYVLYRSYTSMPSAIGVPAPLAATPRSNPLPVLQAVPGNLPTINAPANAPANVPTQAPVNAPSRAPTPENIIEERGLPAASENLPASAPLRTARNAPPAFSRSQQNHEELADSLQNGYQALQAGDRTMAAAHYQRALQLDPNNTDALLGLGYLAQQENRAEPAGMYFKRALTIDPRNPYALAALSSLSNATGDNTYESRLKSLSSNTPGQSAEQSEANAALQFSLGNTLAAQARWDEAQQAYFKAVAAAPRNPDFLLNLAVSLDQLHQSRLALDYYRKALAAASGTSAHFDPAPVAQRIRALEQALK